MSRVACIVVLGVPHQIAQRDNCQMAILETDEDRLAYLRFLKKYAAHHDLTVYAYCLMINRFQLVAVPGYESSLRSTLRDAHTVYAMYFNSRTTLSVNVWQGPFYSCPLDDPHLWAAVRNVERNPVAAGMAERAETYRWSSAAAHCGLCADDLLSADFPPPDVVKDWTTWLAQPDEDELTAHIRRQTRTGRPCGHEDFVDQVENLLNRRVRPEKRGRTSKKLAQQDKAHE